MKGVNHELVVDSLLIISKKPLSRWSNVKFELLLSYPHRWYTACSPQAREMLFPTTQQRSYCEVRTQDHELLDYAATNFSKGVTIMFFTPLDRLPVQQRWHTTGHTLPAKKNHAIRKGRRLSHLRFV